MSNLSESEAPQLLLNDNIFRGIGAIETLAIKEGKFLNFKCHVKRLSAAFTFFKLEGQIPKLESIFYRGLSEFNKLASEGLLRVYIPYSSDNADPIFRFTPKAVPTKIECEPITFSLLPYLTGYTFKTMSRMVYHNTENTKTILFVDEAGFICESQNHSILLCKRGYLFTPRSPMLASPSTAIDGIRNQSIKVYEAYIKTENLESFDWAILINSGSYKVLHNKINFDIDAFIDTLHIFKQ